MKSDFYVHDGEIRKDLRGKKKLLLQLKKCKSILRICINASYIYTYIDFSFYIYIDL